MQTQLTSDDRSKIEMILNGNFDELITFANKMASEKLAKKYTDKNGKQKLSKDALTTSQIRNFFDSLQRIRTFKRNELQLLRAKLAYVGGRTDEKKKLGIQTFQEIMDWAIQKTNEGNFQNLKHLAEALVAYHRYHGGEE